MYLFVLVVHSWLRWVALVAGVGATAAAFAGPLYTERADRADLWGLVLMMALDVQMLLGLALYLALSPITAQAMNDFGGAMAQPALRFWGVEHISAMFGAVILAHVARVMARNASTPASKRTRLLVCFGLATLLMIARTPWPGMAIGRPLFRF